MHARRTLWPHFVVVGGVAASVSNDADGHDALVVQEMPTRLGPQKVRHKIYKGV